MEQKEQWSSRLTFILASIGSAVGLGNAWRFPGLAAKYGGGAFLLVYALSMIILGIPMLSMEIAIGRKTKQGAIGAFRSMNKKAEFVGWSATANAFCIAVYYAVVFAWVLAMVVFSTKFVGMVGKPEEASQVFFNMTQATGAIQGAKIPFVMAIALLVAWTLIYLCVRKGTVSVGKVVKYTGLTLPLIFLCIMAAKGISMPGGLTGVKKLFVPDFKDVIKDGNLGMLVVDAIGQVFYSLSIMMAIMFAYGSYLSEEANVAKDATIIACADLGVSVLSGIVMFSTMYGVGMTTNDMTDSGIATAFIVFPQAMSVLTKSGWFNAIFGMVFYLCLSSLAVDSAFSIIEGVSRAISANFKLNARKVTMITCIIAAVLSIVFITQSGLAWLDIVDNWTNQYNMIIIGVLECVVIGWIFDTRKVLKEINRNTEVYKMPAFWFIGSIRCIAPFVLLGFGGFNFYELYKDHWIYENYPKWALFAGGWMITILVFASGFIAKLVLKKKEANSEDHHEVWEEK